MISLREDKTEFLLYSSDTEAPDFGHHNGLGQRSLQQGELLLLAQSSHLLGGREVGEDLPSVMRRNLAREDGGRIPPELSSEKLHEPGAQRLGVLTEGGVDRHHLAPLRAKWSTLIGRDSLRHT